MSTRPPFLIRLRAYQRVRFPLVPLYISLIPAIVSSSVIVQGTADVLSIVLAVAAVTAYLFHIRVLDEHRDFEHDNLHYKERPIQAGTVSRLELRYVAVFAVAVLLTVALQGGAIALMVAFLMLGYSYLAEKEFFLGMRLRSHFFLYNGVNLLQMLLMQVFAYAYFSGTLLLHPIVWMHFLFTTSGTLIFELLRKLKLPGADGTGRDTYTAYLGFTGALTAYALLLLINSGMFVGVLVLSSALSLLWLYLMLALLFGSLLWALLHWLRKSPRTELLVQGSFLVQYGILNVLIALAIM